MNDKSDRRILTRSDAPGAVFDLYANDMAPEIFCDGLSGAAINGVVTRLFLHVITEPTTPQQPREGRTLVLKLVLPTHTAIEALQKVLEGYVANQSQLVGAVDVQRNAIVDTLTKLSARGETK